MEEKLVVFELAGTTYGTDVAQVQGIISPKRLSPYLARPLSLEGVVNLHGIGKMGEARAMIFLDPAHIFSQEEQQALAVAQGG